MSMMKKLLLLSLLTAMASAAPVLPTRVGKLKSVQGQTIVVENADGSTWVGHLLPGWKNYAKGGLSEERTLVFRIRGPMNVQPREVDLVCEPSESARFVSGRAPAPYQKREGFGPGSTVEPPENAPRIPRTP